MNFLALTVITFFRSGAGFLSQLVPGRTRTRLRVQRAVTSIAWLTSACAVGVAAPDSFSVLGISEFKSSDVLHRKLPVNLTYQPEDLGHPLRPEIAAKLDAKFAELFDKARGHAVSAAIFVPGEGLWTAAKGGSTEAHITIHSGFHAASIGKAMTATLVLELIQDKRFRLDTPIARWFPELPNSNRVTIDQLLSHTSGLTDPGNLVTRPDYFRTAKAVERDMQGSKPMFSPGSKWSYFNSGYVLLGQVIERERGKPYDEVLRERLLEPLSLADTHVVTRANQREILVENYFEGKSGFEAIDYAVPLAAGPVSSTPRDLITFYHALLNHRILRPETTELMWDRLYPMSPGALYWGRGLMLLRSPLGEVVYSAGGAKGFNCVLAYSPDKRAYIAVMCNDTTPATAYFFHLLGTL